MLYMPTTLNPKILLVGVYFTEIFAQVHKIYIRMLTIALFYHKKTENILDVHQPGNKLWYICTMDHYTAVKNNVLKWKDLQKTVKWKCEWTVKWKIKWKKKSE